MVTLDELYLPSNFQVGGIQDNLVNQVLFVGLNESEVKTGSIGVLQLGFQWKMTESIYLTGRANAGLVDFYKTGIENVSASNNLLSGYSLSAGMMSPIGPIEISVMYSDQDGTIYPNLNLGYKF